MMRMLRVAFVASTAALIVFGVAGPAAAHPLGNFSINRFSGLEISIEDVRLHYVVDMAEIPTLQELRKTGVGHSESLEAYATSAARRLQSGLELKANGDVIDLELGSSHASLRDGQGGLSILRIDLRLVGQLPSPTADIVYRDENYADRLGWQEIVASAVDGQGLRSSTVPAVSPTGGLRSYPRDSLSSPFDVSVAQLSVAPGTSSPSSDPRNEQSGGGELAGEWFSSLITREISPGFVAVALMLALGAGALHALGPGHGKSVMAAYLVGTNGRVRHAIAVGCAISVMHTVSVLVLGMVTLWAADRFPPERVYPWLSLASGMIVVGLGSCLLAARLRSRRTQMGNGHKHEHRHSHEHVHSHDHGLGAHTHAPPTHTSPLSWRGLGALALSGGLLPSPSALVVLLGAVALHRIAFGLTLVAAFSVGLAGALTLLGVVVLRARSFASRRMGTRVLAVMPLLSALFILSIGLVITARAATVL